MISQILIKRRVRVREKFERIGRNQMLDPLEHVLNTIEALKYGSTHSFSMAASCQGFFFIFLTPKNFFQRFFLFMTRIEAERNIFFKFQNESHR
jgi:hypothetical protein